MMNRFPTGSLWVAAGLAVVLIVTEAAEAQRGGGRRGRGLGRWLSPVRLASIETVQTELKLSDEQKEKVDEINDRLGAEMRGLFEQGGDNREQLQKLNNDASAELNQVLDENQQKRLIGILAQVNMEAALNNPTVVAELNITEDQKAKMTEVRDANRQAMRDAWEELRDQDLSREDFGAKMAALRTESDKKLLAVLTSEQQAQLEQLKGEPVEIDMSQFRFGRGGGRGGRDRDRDRERGQRAGEAQSE
jgi:Spy/CpxP family protein refolding chaperone